MKLIPALDLMDGSPVRLSQGDFTARTTYSAQPRAALENYAGAGAELAHVVDLDGAKAREPRQHELIASMTDVMPLQVAGGFRTCEQVGRMLDAGAARVVIGSLALSKPSAFIEILNCFGVVRITLALDVKLDNGNPVVMTAGWTENSGRSIHDVLDDFPSVSHLLVTDVDRDGMLDGPNLDLYRNLVRRFPSIAVQASGGVASLADLDELNDIGVSGAIVGKAIWDGRFTVDEGVIRACG